MTKTVQNAGTQTISEILYFENCTFYCIEINLIPI